MNIFTCFPISDLAFGALILAIIVIADNKPMDVCSLTVSLSLFHWYPGLGVVLDCIDS